MGGRSKSSSGANTQQQTNSTMSSLSRQAGKLGEAAQGYGNLQTALVGQMFPAFGEMVKGGMESLGQNPMANIMGAALGMPIQMETPEFAQNFIDKYRPEEPTAAPQQQPYNVNDDMRARMGMGTPYGQYGQYGPQRNSMFGGAGR